MSEGIFPIYSGDYPKEIGLPNLRDKRSDMIHYGLTKVSNTHVSMMRDIAYQCIGTVLMREDFRKSISVLTEFVKSK